MSGYAGSPSGYLNPVAVDKIQHPDYDAKERKRTAVMRMARKFVSSQELQRCVRSTCKETDAGLADLADNMEFLKKVYNNMRTGILISMVIEAADGF